MSEKCFVEVDFRYLILIWHSIISYSLLSLLLLFFHLKTFSAPGSQSTIHATPFNFL